jgi:phospholipase/carboxylesterase
MKSAKEANMTDRLLEGVEINPETTPSYVVIWLHGLGADGHDFEAIVPALDLPGSMPVRYVFPHAPMRAVTINGGMVMRAWYDILDLDISRKVDVDSIHESAGLLTNLIQRELDAGIPSDHIILAGFSQGGAIVLQTGLRYEKPLAGILALSTYSPTVTSLAAEGDRINRNIPIMMAHGEYDPVIPLSIAINTRDELLKLDYAVQWHAYPMQHEVCIEEIQEIGHWMRNVMK